MLILPLPARPDWGRPPWATILVMLLCLLAFLVQGGDYRRAAEAARFYQQSGLARIELAAYRAELARDPAAAKRGPPAGDPGDAMRLMEDDVEFMRRLRRNQVVTPADPAFPAWRSSRSHYEKLRERVVTERFALDGRAPRPASLLGHLFLHADVMHLAGNMAVLFVVGYTVEAALGPLGFLALYLLGGFGAALPDLVFPAAGPRLSLGASGAISAVMAAYLVLFGRRRIRFFYWLLFFFGTLRWPALAILPLWLANELLQNFVFDRGGPVNYLAHFAGLLAGALLAGLYRWRRHGRSADSVHRQDAEQAIQLLRRRAERHVAELQFRLAAQVYRKIFAEYPLLETALAEEYLRIARLSRSPELLADAERQYLKAAAHDPGAATPAVLAEVVEAGLFPGLAGEQWGRLVDRLIAGGQLDAAERIVRRLFALPDVRNTALRQAKRLAGAFEAAGRAERSAPLRRLLSARSPGR